jgi:hypothetical protein
MHSFLQVSALALLSCRCSLVVGAPAPAPQPAPMDANSWQNFSQAFGGLASVNTGSSQGAQHNETASKTSRPATQDDYHALRGSLTTRHPPGHPSREGKRTRAHKSQYDGQAGGANAPSDLTDQSAGFPSTGPPQYGGRSAGSDFSENFPSAPAFDLDQYGIPSYGHLQRHGSGRFRVPGDHEFSFSTLNLERFPSFDWQETIPVQESLYQRPVWENAAALSGGKHSHAHVQQDTLSDPQYSIQPRQYYHSAAQLHSAAQPHAHGLYPENLAGEMVKQSSIYGAPSSSAFGGQSSFEHVPSHDRSSHGFILESSAPDRSYHPAEGAMQIHGRQEFPSAGVRSAGLSQTTSTSTKTSRLRQRLERPFVSVVAVEDYPLLTHFYRKEDFPKLKRMYSNVEFAGFPEPVKKAVIDFLSIQTALKTKSVNHRASIRLDWEMVCQLLSGDEEQVCKAIEGFRHPLSRSWMDAVPRPFIIIVLEKVARARNLPGTGQAYTWLAAKDLGLDDGTFMLHSSVEEIAARLAEWQRR